jgi:hypothetical protein
VAKEENVKTAHVVKNPPRAEIKEAVIQKPILLASRNSDSRTKMKKTGSGTKYTGTVVLGRNERQEQFVS